METAAEPTRATSILLVEDEKEVLEILATIIARKFPAVALHPAANGKAGLELFIAHRPAIVITDINMPEMGGVQMASRIRALKPDTRFIVLTGDTQKLFPADGGTAGCAKDHYINKPVGLEELFAAIERCLGEVAAQQETEFGS